MYGTIVQNSFSKNDAPFIAEYLDDLCSPTDYYGWSSTGIYTFWNYNTREILYIGLATDLSQRFKQHLGLTASNSHRGTKYLKIEEYFQSNTTLGYSVLLQSILGQATIRKNFSPFSSSIQTYTDIENRSLSDYNREDIKINLKDIEGQLIESFKQVHGHFPSWNSIGGSIVGQSKATRENYELIRSFSTSQYSPFVARSTLKELSHNPTLERYENFLHIIRFMMIQSGLTFDDALTMLIHRSQNGAETFRDIHHSEYLRKQPVI